MKVILDIKEGFTAACLCMGKRIDLQDGMCLKAESAGEVVISIAPDAKPIDKPMHAGGKSGASGSLSFA